MCLNTMAQRIVYVDTEQYARILESEVSSVAEFVERFNGKALHPEVDSTQEYWRITNIYTLFRHSMFTTFNTETDSAFREAIEFATAVTDSNRTISENDSTWFAVADCSATCKGKPVKVKLWLSVKMYPHPTGAFPTWTICKAEADFLKLTPADTTQMMFISPTYHEVNFMSLADITKTNAQNITRFSYDWHNIDQTSVFFSMVRNRELAISQVDTLIFELYQIPGYKVTVSHSFNLKENDGWLIDKLEKCPADERDRIIKDIYNIR